MDALREILRTSHIWAGFALLALFWIPLIVKKGAPKRKFSWLREHYTNMIISGGAAYAAFLAFGARAFFTFPDKTVLAVLPWVLPTVFALMAVTYYNKQYVK